jgi:hypothetical protein
MILRSILHGQQLGGQSPRCPVSFEWSIARRILDLELVPAFLVKMHLNRLQRTLCANRYQLLEIHACLRVGATAHVACAQTAQALAPGDMPANLWRQSRAPRLRASGRGRPFNSPPDEGDHVRVL